MNTEIYHCLLEIACKGMLPRHLSHSNPTDCIYQIQHCASTWAQQTPNWLVSLEDTAPCAWKQIGYINVMVCLGYSNLFFAKMPCYGMLGHYFTPGLFQGKRGCLPASSRHAYWGQDVLHCSLIHGVKSCSTCSLVEGFCFWCWGFLFDRFPFNCALKSEIEAIPGSMIAAEQATTLPCTSEPASWGRDF